ncbi:MAG: RidA family protein [Clostridia bacterium]|jgi:2-iminobutanoate/2-iminopropanoate deaminase
MEKQIIKVNSCPAAIGPYSQAVRAGDFLFTSGMIPIDPVTGKIVSEDIDEQTHMVFKNLTNLLTGAGTSLSNIIKTTVYIKNMNDFSKINTIYAEYFTSGYPARSCVEVAKLPKDVLIEVECIAKF